MARWPLKNLEAFSTAAVISAGLRRSQKLELKARACGWRRDDVRCIGSSLFESRRKTRCPDLRSERVRPRPIPLAAPVMSQLRGLAESMVRAEASSLSIPGLCQ